MITILKIITAVLGFSAGALLVYPLFLGIFEDSSTWVIFGISLLAGACGGVVLAWGFAFHT